MSTNPYEAPQTFDDPPVQPDDPETIREEHINTEASIKSVGFLYYLVGVFIMIGGLSGLSNLDVPENLSELGYKSIPILVLIGGMASIVVGSAVRRLKRWSRIGVGILSGVGLLAFPMGTLINAYILFLTFGKRGRMIFSPRYKEIIAVTPHVKCRTSKMAWILLATVVIFVVILFTALLLGNR